MDGNIISLNNDRLCIFILCIRSSGNHCNKSYFAFLLVTHLVNCDWRCLAKRKIYKGEGDFNLYWSTRFILSLVPKQPLQSIPKYWRSIFYFIRILLGRRRIYTKTKFKHCIHYITGNFALLINNYNFNYFCNTFLC